MAKKSASNDLLSKLGQALDKPQFQTAEPADPSAGSLLKANGSNSHARAGKITATIYPTDWRRLDEIKDFFRSRGFRNLSDSEALRIACRAVRIDDGLISYYEAMKQEDGRQRRIA